MDELVGILIGIVLKSPKHVIIRKTFDICE